MRSTRKSRKGRMRRRRSSRDMLTVQGSWISLGNPSYDSLNRSSNSCRAVTAVRAFTAKGAQCCTYISTIGMYGNGYVCTLQNITVVYFTIVYCIVLQCYIVHCVIVSIGHTHRVYCGNLLFMGNYEINADVIH